MQPTNELFRPQCEDFPAEFVRSHGLSEANDLTDEFAGVQ